MCLLTLCNPFMDCSPSGSSVHGIFQVGILEWVAISYSGGSSQTRDWTCVPCVSCIGRQILYTKCSYWVPNSSLDVLLRCFTFSVLPTPSLLWGHQSFRIILIVYKFQRCKIWVTGWAWVLQQGGKGVGEETMFKTFFKKSLLCGALEAPLTL